MANRPPKYCASFPCGNLAVPGSSYCPDHRPARAPKEADDFYVSVAWRRFRSWYLRNHPLCELCRLEGRTTPAMMVDHITELVDGGAPLEEENAMSLCWKCHGLKTSDAKNHRKSSENNRLASATLSLLGKTR